MDNESKSNVVFVNFFTKKRVENQDQTSKPEMFDIFENMPRIKDRNKDMLTNGEVKGISFRIDQILVELENLSETDFEQIENLEQELFALESILEKSQVI